MKRIIAIGLLWKTVDSLDKDTVKKIAFQKGFEISQKYKDYEVWENGIEPFLISQLHFITTVSNSFIKGLLSDNKNNKKDKD